MSAILYLSYGVAFMAVGFYCGFLVGYRWREAVDAAGGLWRWTVGVWRRLEG